jgi:NAD(P)-dependent dehydrogenase (short-subunit alcohol dehydrogenase family)
MLLSDKICVMTGAASQRGIGRATARLFAKHGARSIILDLDGDAAKAAASGPGEAHRGFACGVTDKAAFSTAIDKAISPATCQPTPPVPSSM